MSESRGLRRWKPASRRAESQRQLVNNSWGGGMDVNEEIAERMIRDSAELGVRIGAGR
jgi:hypothetical protein